MEEYIRKEPFFSLCGLNCCLCPRYHTDGASKCPGCGGPEFSSKHPTCAVVTCNKKHDRVEYCFECSEYPCKKYKTESPVDSFVSYKNVLQNFDEANKNLNKYLKDLKKRYEYLIILLEKYNDGKSKGLYCLAANLIPLYELTKIMKHIEADIEPKSSDLKEKAKEITKILKEKAQELNIELVLRK